MKSKIVLLAAVMAGWSDPGVSEAEGFRLVGRNPVVAKTPFRRMDVLHAWDGRIYMGYGDAYRHAGPIVVTSFDPEANQFVAEFSAGTDVIKVFREIGDRLFIPSGDGIHYRGFDDYAVLTGRSQGYSRSPIGMLHMWDVCTLDGTNVWVVGSPRGVSRYSEAERDWNRVAEGDGYWQWMVVLNGALHLQGRSRLPDATWRSNFVDRPMYKAERVVTATGEVAVGRTEGAGFSETSTESDFVSQDGMTVRSHFRIRDFAVDGSTVYVLKRDRTVWRAPDLHAAPDHWEDVGLDPAPFSVGAIAVLEGVVYVATQLDLWAAPIDGGAPADDASVGFVDELPDRFGSSIAFQDDRLLVGAPHQGGPEVQAGAAYLYRREGPAWELEERFAPTNEIQQSGFFGDGVALGGDHLAILASGYLARDDRGDRARVHVYRYEATSEEWAEVAGSPVEVPFAQAVAVSADGLLVVADEADCTVWEIEPALRLARTMPMGRALDAYEPVSALRLDGDVLAIGHRGDPSREGGPGQVLVWRRDERSFVQVTRLSTAQADWFGNAVDHHGGILAVGAPADDTGGENAGAVHLYTATDGYTAPITLFSPQPARFAFFGTSVALGDGVLVVGARDDDCLDRQPGAAYLFRHNPEDDAWVFDHKIAPPAAVTAAFGVACDIAGATAAIGGAFSGRGEGYASELATRLRLVDLRDCPLKRWGGSYGLSDLETLSASDRDGDAIPPLVEFAYGLDPTIPDRRVVKGGSGRTGLPRIDTADAHRVEITAVRRRVDRLSYRLESSLDGTSWAPDPAWEESLAPIDDEWERVTHSRISAGAGGRLVRFVLGWNNE